MSLSFPSFVYITEAVSQQQEASSEVALALGQVRMMTVKTGNVLPLRLIPPGSCILTSWANVILILLL